ncbi:MULTISPECIES: ABC transporter substrate-binding protein [Halorussus]|uniref:ABC transporter substrate-binding protein n=1 Tax=Halorussus TaxID=1070314 RepID=UPI000E21624E|nr:MULTISPECIES: ABC transporter substrate-binding protein [Halorussus]NHN61290.1 carbohydrate ABC transporter substrate-binding protein [Halorussus sp. JP-T4]
MGANDDTFSRRRYLKATGAAGAAGLGSLTGYLDAQNNPLEVQHWWTGGDGGRAISALFEGFREQYPDVQVNENPVAGGAGQNLHTVIKKRVLNNNPPSTWQDWPGQNLTPYTDAGVLEDIEESVWDQNDMKSAYLEGPKQVAQPAGNYVTVPLNIHRLNNLFYNVEVVEQAGVDPTSFSSPSDLLAALETVEAETDAAGMAHQTQSPWSTLQLWETELLARHGQQTYEQFANGNVGAVESQVKDALEAVKGYRQYFNDDAGSVDWTQANSKVVNGGAAFIHQGDWAAGMYRGQDGFEYEQHWNQVTYPGTSGMYSLVIDSFPFPKNNPSPDATTKFLRYVGSVDGQRRFNPLKGSIPPRTDVPRDAFGPFLRSQMDDFQNAQTQPPSTAHGLAVTPEQLTNLEGAISTFNSSWNVQRTFDQLQQAFQ